MKKKILSLCLVVAMVATAVAGASMAFLTDEDSAVNVMTLGNVDIELIEQQRSGGPDSDLEPFENGKTLYPIVGSAQGEKDKWGLPTAANYVDKIVSVKNTGASEAYIRVLVAVPAALENDDASKNALHWNLGNRFDVNGEGEYNASDVTEWQPDYAYDYKMMTTVTVDGIEYNVYAFTYERALLAGETFDATIVGFYLDENLDNEDGQYVLNGNVIDYDISRGVYIPVISQAVQTAGFANAAAALNEGFGEVNKENATDWFNALEMPINYTRVEVTPENFGEVDFTASGKNFVLSGEFGNIAINEVSAASALTFNDVTATSVTLNGTITLTGDNKLDTEIKVNGTGEEDAKLYLVDATVDLGDKAVSVSSPDAHSLLEIENSVLKCSTIFVGGHTNTEPNATTEFNVKNSYISCEENGLGSTISIWGQSGVDAEILDSEIHTYSRGWHQSEDANDNSITFQGNGHINVNIERSNMHLYGARSIINAREYYGDCEVNFTIDDSLIWVVTKSTHGEETLPVWNATSINDTVLVFTKGVYGSNPVDIKTDVYGDPVIHGSYAVTTQCGWTTNIAVGDDQTVTIAEDADISVYEGAAEVNFVLSGTGKVVVKGSMTNIGVKAADGYTLNTNEANGVTTYTVSAVE